jgi:N-acetylglucosaminyldiphosphoundecaprenol N-acetyl-beta-D-mannosaminyltransferase
MRCDTAVPPRRDLFGVAVDALTMAQAVERCQAAVEQGDHLSIGVVNAAKIVSMQRDRQLREAVAGCGMVLADGQSVVWASRILRAPLPERVAGVDLFLELLAEASQRGYRAFFLGARPDVLAAMLDEVARRFPGLKIAGAHDGYFQAEDEPQVAEEIERSDADLLFVGMSSPQKELFLSRWGAATQARVVHGVGGSFDVLAGVTKRAPVRWQRIGLEWLYRLLQEPRRLGPRYLKTNLAFMALVARDAMRHRRGQQSVPAATDSPAQMPLDPVTPVIPTASAVTTAQGEDR